MGPCLYLSSHSTGAKKEEKKISPTELFCREHRTYQKACLLSQVVVVLAFNPITQEAEAGEFL